MQFFLSNREWEKVFLGVWFNPHVLLTMLFLFPPPPPLSSCRIASGIPSQACIWIRARGDLEESW